MKATLSGGSAWARDAGFQGLLERIAASAEVTDRERETPRDIIDDMAGRGLFRLLVPLSVGGGEIDFLDYLGMARAVAQADGSTGWHFNQNNVLGTMASLMPASLAEEIWSDPRAILCNGPPQHTAIVPAEGGYLLTGRWNFSSGSRHATWVVAAGRIGGSETHTLLAPREAVEFIDTWQVKGLRGTGSFSFETEGLFVPASRSFIEAKTPREDGPLYLIPRSLFFGAGFGAVALGVARSALDAAIDLATRKTPQEQALLRDQPSVQREVGRGEALWGAANAFLMEKASQLWGSATERREAPIRERIELRLAATHAIRQAAEATDIAYGVFGATAIFESSPVQRRFQDAHAITQQIQGRMEHYDTAGQFFLGLEPQGRFF